MKHRSKIIYEGSIEITSVLKNKDIILGTMSIEKKIRSKTKTTALDNH